jgi:hypothetical protein
MIPMATCNLIDNIIFNDRLDGRVVASAYDDEYYVIFAKAEVTRVYYEFEIAV